MTEAIPYGLFVYGRRLLDFVVLTLGNVENVH